MYIVPLDLVPSVNISVVRMAQIAGLSFDVPFNDVAYSVARNRLIRAHRFINGKCASCESPVAPSSTRRCVYHLRKEREYAKRGERMKKSRSRRRLREVA